MTKEERYELEILKAIYSKALELKGLVKLSSNVIVIDDECRDITGYIMDDILGSVDELISTRYDNVVRE